MAKKLNLALCIPNQVKGDYKADTLDNILNKYENIYLIKIDTEGHEDKVLEGAQTILQNIQYLYIEMWNDGHYFNRTQIKKRYNREILSYLTSFNALKKMEKKNVLFEKIK